MKTNFLIVIILTSVSFFACKKDSAVNEMKNQPSTIEILTGITTGNQTIEKSDILPQIVYWKISQVIYDGIEVTGYLKGFRFEFLPDQTVVATYKGNLFSIYGKWDMPDEHHLVMYYDTSTLPYDIEFDKFLNGQWVVFRSSYYGIYMESDDNNIHRKLLFERIF